MPNASATELAERAGAVTLIEISATAAPLMSSAALIS